MKGNPGFVTRQHKICNLKPSKLVNFLTSLPDVLTLWPTLSFSFNLFICPSSITNVELRMLEERRESKEKREKEGSCFLPRGWGKEVQRELRS